MACHSRLACDSKLMCHFKLVCWFQKLYLSCMGYLFGSSKQEYGIISQFKSSSAAAIISVTFKTTRILVWLKSNDICQTAE